MDIFSEVEGLKGENLGSALFRYLIFNSHEIRDSIISLLSDKSPIGPIGYSSHFACSNEYLTIDEKGDNNGRLDILIQLDDVVIGIENKFFADFQEGQPHKYLKSISDVADSLSKINRSEVRTLLYILCPESRKKDALLKIKDIENGGVITWEEVLVVCKNTNDITNPLTKVVLGEFVKYLKRHFSFIHDFERKTVHMRSAFPDYGSALQYELVAKLWSIFPSPGGATSKGKTWIGYYFYNNPDIEQKGWFGFLPSNEIKDQTENNAELVVVSTYKPLLSDDFKEVQLVNDNFLCAPGNKTAWVINFDNKWNSVDVWREKLSPFSDVVKDDAD